MKQPEIYPLTPTGAAHLRSSARDLTFFQYHSIDVITLILGTLVLGIWILVQVLTVIYRVLCSFVISKPKLPVKVDAVKKRK